ncbi:MAG: choice-of-anchor L domain-containing protein [Tannerella sp.]|nr:choice-of-anchor L domain-containing protein [Tannerella sp.]
MKTNSYLTLLILLLCLAGSLRAQRRAPADQETTALADSLKREYIARGIDAETAERRARSVAARTGAELRSSFYNAVPLPGSIWLDRDSLTGAPNASHTHNFTPEQFVKDVFVKGGSEIADQAIRNVTLISSTWNGSPSTTWNDKGYTGPFGGDAGTWVPNTDGYEGRELLYFDHGDTTAMADSWDGVPNAVKKFGLDKGFLLATGPALWAEGSNVSNGALGGGYDDWATLHGGTAPPYNQRDPDLSPIASNNIYTLTSLEFDFRSYTDSVSFEFIFVSEEFSDYSNSSVNDIFGFFVSRPGHPLTDALGYTGDTINIARYPNGQPVTINNSNWGYRGTNTYPNFDPLGATPVSETGWPIGDARNAVSPEYFQPLYQYDLLTEYDGHSIVLTAKAGLQKGEWYHMKLAIGNVGDQAYGSGVFLKAGSLDLGAPESDVPRPYLKSEYDSIYGFNSLYAGCENELVLKFDPAASDRNIDVWSMGSGAAYTVDYTLDKTFKDTVRYELAANDTVLNVPFKILNTIPDGSSLFFYSQIQGSMDRDTSEVFTLYAKSEFELHRFTVPTSGYAGALDLIVSKGSPYIQRSLTGGLTWQFARDTITGDVLPFSQSQIANMADSDAPFIIFREPNTCCEYDTVFLEKPVVLQPPIIRTVVLPDIPGVILDPLPGVYRIESRTNYTFTVTPLERNAAQELRVTTSRTKTFGSAVTEEEDVRVTFNPETGDYTVTIWSVQEPVTVYLEFVTPEATAPVDENSVWAHDGALSIRSATPAEASVRAVSGILLHTLRLNPGETVTQHLPAGFYLVSVHGKTYKVAVR